jgi:hypothetical protein
MAPDKRQVVYESRYVCGALFSSPSPGEDQGGMWASGATYTASLPHPNLLLQMVRRRRSSSMPTTITVSECPTVRVLLCVKAGAMQ